MKQFLLPLALVSLPLGAAQADVILDAHLSGTGDNVIFDSLLGNVATGTFNGQNTGIVRFTDLSGNPAFIGASNGNDIKIANTSDLQIQVFNTAGLIVLPTLTDVFSLKGTGDVTAFVSANDSFGNPELVKTFDLGIIDPNAQSGFTLTAINGETINRYALVDVGGSITDFEHYRIDVAPLAVPGPIVGAGFPGLIAIALGLLGIGPMRRRWR